MNFENGAVHPAPIQHFLTNVKQGSPVQAGPLNQNFQRNKNFTQ